MKSECLRTRLPVRLTEHAGQQIRWLKSQVESGKYLRLGIKRSPYFGSRYILKFDDIREGDYKLRVSDVELIVHASHAMYVTGLRIDFIGGAFRITAHEKKMIVEWGKIENIYFP